MNGADVDVAELSQGDEDELVAVSFAGLFDLERGESSIPVMGGSQLTG